MKTFSCALSSLVAGFSIMSLELVFSRIAAPQIGTSVYTWTAVIGVTLLGLSIGNYIGGLLADKYGTTKALPLSFIISAAIVFILPFLSQYTSWILESSDSIVTLTISLSLYLFLLPALTIGSIQPLVVKRYIDDVNTIGKKYGWLSALWSLGSIVGVFMTGFYFISHIGSRETVMCIALLLAVTGIFVASSSTPRKIFVSVVLIGFVAFSLKFDRVIQPRNIIFHKETAYYDAKVVDFTMYPYGKSRALMLDFDSHSVEFNSPVKNQVYTAVSPLFGKLKPNLDNILVIGAGAYTLPKNLKSMYPKSSVKVIEIDPEVETISEKYFNLKPANITTEVGDARLQLAKSDSKYDLIYGDAYNSFISVPGHLLTEEFNLEIKNHLTDGGIYAVNFISSLEGENSEMFKSVYATFAQAFPNNYVTHWDGNKEAVQSITLIGINGTLHKDEKDLIKELTTTSNPYLAQTIVSNPKDYLDPKAIVLTDNFYPTERLMNTTISNYYPTFKKFTEEIYR